MICLLLVLHLQNERQIRQIGELSARMKDCQADFDYRVVAGDVESGSIQRAAGRVDFMLVQEKQRLKVAYLGSEPLPDTFRDGAQALADGKMGRDGVFYASKIQAKCASKYEAAPGGDKPAPSGTTQSSM